MGGKVSLPLTIEIAFTAGALDTGTLTWTDVSSYVRKESISFNRGWDTESQEPIAGRAALSFNNESGNFTPGKTGAFGLIRNRLPIRIKQGSTVLWTGLVESWRIGWTNGMRSKVDVTAVDRWAALRRLKITPDRFLLTADLTSADVAFRLGDTAAPFRPWRGEALWGNGLAEQSSATLKAPTFVAEADPFDPAILHPRIEPVLGTGVLIAGGTNANEHWSLDTGVTLTALMRARSAAAGDWLEVGIYNGISGVAVGVYGTGDIKGSVRAFVGTLVNAVGAASSLVTGNTWFVVSVTAKRTAGTITMRTYLNGVQVGTTGSAAGSDLPSGTLASLTIGGNSGGAGQLPVYSIGGVFAHKRELSVDEVKFVSRQAASWAGDAADVRAATLKQFGPITLSTTGTFTATMSMQDLADKPLADALLECAQAEDGALFIDTSGWPKITSRSWRTQATVAFTIPAKALASDIGWTLDDQQLTNSSAVDRMVGDATAGTATGRNDASVTLYGEQKVSRQLWLYNTADAVERANAEANMWANPLPRSSELTVDLMTKGATISAATLLAADIGQRIAISGMPAEAPTQTNFYIEAISDTVTETSWLRTFTVSPRLDFLTLDDASSGAIDSTFVLAP